MARRDARELARRLGQRAEAVCARYLPNGRREGRHWRVGDVRNTPGQSMFVRLVDTPKGPAGKWCDPATGEHGDLLDLIATACGLAEFAEIAREARAFLALPPEPERRLPPIARPRSAGGTPGAARRLFAASRPLAGTLAESVLRGRGLADLRQTGSLRFHPRCFYRPTPDQPSERWPALIAAVTDLDEKITGVHRTWLDPGGFDPARLGKAPFERPRRGLGDLLGNAVRFGKAADVLAAGEGIETVLSVRQVLPGMPMAAALSADHLAAMAFPPALRRLYILRDADAAGDRARDILFSRAREAGIETVALSPRLEDFNEDLRRQGPRALLAGVLAQLVPEDTERWRHSR